MVVGLPFSAAGSRSKSTGSRSPTRRRCWSETSGRCSCSGNLTCSFSRNSTGGAVLNEQHDEWADGRRYLGLDVFHRSRLALITTPSPQEDTQTAGAINA